MVRGPPKSLTGTAVGFVPDHLKDKVAHVKQWKIIKDKSDECWSCGMHRFTIMFWKHDYFENLG